MSLTSRGDELGAQTPATTRTVGSNYLSASVIGILDRVVAVSTGTLMAWFGIGADSASMGPDGPTAAAA